MSVARQISLPIQRNRKELRGLDSAGNSRAKDTLSVDISGLLEDDINWVIQSIVHTEVTDQVKMGNDPSGMFVDKRANKPLRDVKNNVVVNFGNLVQRNAITAAQKALLQAIKLTTTARSGNLQSLSNWDWYYADISGGKRTRGRKVDPLSLGHLQLNERLYLVPNQRLSYIGFANMKVARRGQDFTPTRGKNRGIKRIRRIGFMGYAAERMRKTRVIKTAFRVWVEFTQEFGNGTDYPHGTPCFVFRPTATLLNRRRYQPRSRK